MKSPRTVRARCQRAAATLPGATRLSRSAACTFSASQGNRAGKPTAASSSWRRSRVRASRFASGTGARASTRRESRGDSSVSRTAGRTLPSRALGSPPDTSRRWCAPRRSSAFCRSSSTVRGSVNSSMVTLKSRSTPRSCSAVNDPPPRSISLRRACDKPSFVASSACVHRCSVRRARTRGPRPDGAQTAPTHARRAHGRGGLPSPAQPLTKSISRYLGRPQRWSATMRSAASQALRRFWSAGTAEAQR